MDKEVKAALVATIVAIGIFFAAQPIIPQPTTKGFSELAILGPDQTLSGYPTQVVVGGHFLLYGYVENEMGFVEYYQSLVKLGSQYTKVSNLTAANAPVLSSYLKLLSNTDSADFPVDLAINQTGTNQRLIFELWSYDSSLSSFTYTGLWDEIWLNVTSS
jgi:uncharacterized membrane protein